MPSYLGAEALAAGGLELSQAQRAEGNNPGTRRGMALDSRDSRGGYAVLAECMTKASSPCQRQEEWKVSYGQELAGMQFPKSCKEKRGKTGGWWEGLV